MGVAGPLAGLDAFFGSQAPPRPPTSLKKRALPTSFASQATGKRASAAGGSSQGGGWD